MTRLVAAYIIENDEDVLELSLKSIINTFDHIYIINSDYYNQDKLRLMIADNKFDISKFTIIDRLYEHTHIGANGRARNAYLDILKKKELGSYCLVLDSDEVLDDRNNILRKFIEDIETEKKPDFEKYGIAADIRMRHTQYNFALEDNTREKHFVARRFFRVDETLSYPEVEHPILISTKPIMHYGIDGIVIWHLGYSREMFRTLKKYKNHILKSNIHDKAYLDWWLRSHLFGQYPAKPFNPVDLPQVIKDYFMVPELNDEVYFAKRGIEIKHPMMVKQWADYFKPKMVAEVGCGKGPYLYFWKWFAETIRGFEISEFAIKNSFVPGEISKIDITKDSIDGAYDLICVLDVLEHLNYNDLDNALQFISDATKSSQNGRRFLFSIPFIGDPNLFLDDTHIIKETKEWWLERLKAHSFEIKETPQHWLFKEQIIVAEK